MNACKKFSTNDSDFTPNRIAGASAPKRLWFSGDRHFRTCFARKPASKALFLTILAAVALSASLASLGTAEPAFGGEPAAPAIPIRVEPAAEARTAAALSGSSWKDVLAEAARGDARINDLCFVSARRGWAVGDRGTILTTEDGGITWSPQVSGVDCPLYSVCFIDDNIGWAAGGTAQPYLHNGRGVLLTTRDGGRTWRHLDKLLLPLVRRVRFFDSRRGIAVAYPSPIYPSGLLATDSGGQAWHPLSGEIDGIWLDGDFSSTDTGIVVGRRGRLAPLRRGEVQPAVSMSALRNLWRVTTVEGSEAAWLVGDGGLVMTSNDSGASWQIPSGLPPESAARHFDFYAVAAVGESVWVAGAPGTRIWHSADGGRSWVRQTTGTAVPLYALSFVDPLHGYAAGALGTILATENGGRSWRVCRGGRQRAAVLGVLADARDVPLELFARLCGFEGYFGVVECVARRDLDAPNATEVPENDRLREAVLSVGGCDARQSWRLPLRQRGIELTIPAIVELWDRATDGRGTIECEADLCRAIRQWRPEIIVTYDADPKGAIPTAHLVNQLTLAAVRSAADPTRFSEQLTEAGLEAWSVPKVFAQLPPSARGGIELVPTQISPRVGRSPAEAAAPARALLETTYSSSPARLCFRLLINSSGLDQAERDFFTGRILPPGGEARRLLPPSLVENLDALRRAAEKRRNVQAIIARMDADPQGGSALLGQAGELTLGLETDAAAEVLYLLADGFRSRGRWLEAADTMNMLAQRYPQHPWAQAAFVWLVQYYAASEPMHRSGLGGNAANIAAEIRSAHAAKAAEIARTMERRLPDLFAAPQVRFPLAVAWRNAAMPQQADRFYNQWLRQSTDEAWKACAAAELWLNDPRAIAPKPVLICTAAAGKPLLDGRLDDELWRRTRPARITDHLRHDDSLAATAYLAYDAEYFYVAVRCPRIPRADSPPAESTLGEPRSPRPRDPDLSRRDRFVLLLDLDRDYATYYRFEIDDRGWAAEDCWGDRTWNPRWFVAAEGDAQYWTAEVAIPLRELTDRLPESRAVWAVGMQRVIPWAGLQSWSAPARVEVAPEGFGLLIFE